MKKTNSTSQLINFDSYPYSKEEDYVTKLKFYFPGTPSNIYTSLSNSTLNRKDKRLPTIELSKMYLKNFNPKLIRLLSPKEKHSKSKYSSIKKNNYISYEKRLENEKFESSREEKHLFLLQVIKKIKQEIKSNYSRLNDLSNLIEQSKISIEVLHDFGQHSQFDKKYKKKDTDLNRLDFRRNSTYKSLIQNQINKIQSVTNEHTITINKLTKEYKELFQVIKNAEKQLHKLKEQYISIKSALVVHYHNLLLEGKDTRNEGLTWIIKRIWRFNEEVILSYMPKFLDMNTINYLFEISRLSIEKDCEEKNLKLLYEEMFLDKQGGNNTSGQTAPTINSEVIKGILGKIDKELDYIENTPKITFEQMNEVIRNCSRNFMDENTERCLRIIEDKKKQIWQLQNKIEKMKTDEVNRINKEFLYYNYQRKFNVPITQVIAAIVGEDHLEIEMGKVNREKRCFTKTLHSVRSFSFLHFKNNIN